MNPKGNLELILESAVVTSWDNSMPGTYTGLIHCEHGFADRGSLDYLKVWASPSRGSWAFGETVLDVSQRVSRRRGQLSQWVPIRRAGSHLGTCDATPELRRASPNLGRQGLLQISTPTAKETAAAAALINVAFDRPASLPAVV